ncbi:MAG: adenylate/guanylate cyclase domain-containing protein, partial [Spirochaetia bacterium]|nr:adenylate/guanylate cyclase domain-containing protein [Spirochaetia bacterium]
AAPALLVPLAYGAVLLFLLRRPTVTPWVKYASSLVDVAAFTVWYAQFPQAAGAAGLLPYLLWVVAALVRFSLYLTAFSTLISVLFFVGALLWTDNVAVISLPQSGVFVIAALFAAYTAYAYERLAGRLGTTERQVRANAVVQEEERTDQRLEFSEKRLRMLESFSRFVPEEFLQFLGRNITEVKLGDAVSKEMTLLFADIRSFSTFAEKMTPEETFKFLNAYLRRMAPVIHKEKGFVDKFIGDEIMALFPEDPDGAIRAAINMMEELRIYNIHRSSFGYEPIKIGIGLHHGDVMLGTVGSDFRLDTTVIVDSVNLASRLQNLTKIFKVPVILSDFVYRSLKNPAGFHFREIDSVRVKGKQNPVVLYEVYDVDEPSVIEGKEKTLPDLQMAMYLYKAGNFADAKAEFQNCMGACPADPIPGIYIKRCDYLLQHPPANWTGVSRMR